MSRPLVPIGIVAHHERRSRAERMADCLDAELIALDEGGLGAGRNHERCYEWLSHSAAPWVLLLEDDAQPVRNFREQLNAVLAANPKQLGVLSLYLGRARPPHWQIPISQVIARDEHFLTATELLHHVAVAIRTPLIPQMLAYIRNDRQYQLGRLPIDEAVGRWCRSVAMKVGYCHPSIVNHDARLPTVIAKHASQHKTDNGERTPQERRTAWTFGVRQGWESSVAAIPEPVPAHPAAAAASPLKR